MAIAEKATLPAYDFDVAMEVASHATLIRQTFRDLVGVLTWCVGMTNARAKRSIARSGNRPVLHCLNLRAWALGRMPLRSIAPSRATNSPRLRSAMRSRSTGTWAIERASGVKLWKAGDVSGAEKAMNWLTPE